MSTEIQEQRWLGRLDRLGIVLSGVCIVHCLALPLLVAALPLLGGGVLGGHSFHEWLLLAVVPVSLVALVFGYRRHGDPMVLKMGAGGLLLLCFATYGYRLVGLPENWERAISIVGGLIHAGGHVLNFRRTRAMHDCAAHTHAH